jgi:hypothetical protein
MASPGKARLVLIGLVGLAVVCLPGARPPPPVVTLERLLLEMASLDALADFPDPPFATVQFSSFDRASATPADAAGWFANHDRGFYHYEGTLPGPTPYFRAPPGPDRKPDGTFPAGTKVGVDRQRPSVPGQVWVYADGLPGRPQGYVAATAFRPNPDGPVLAEVDGPGCLVRLWSANPTAAGRVRIYLDRQSEPVIAGPLVELLQGTWTSRDRRVHFPPPFAGLRGRGASFYFPIPFAQHCRIVAERGDLIYHANFRRYREPVTVRTFTWPQEQAHRDLTAAVAAALEERRPLPPRGTADGVRQRVPIGPVTLAPGRSHDAVVPAGPGGAAVVEVRLDVRSERLDEMLRRVELRGRFDEAVPPQIDCPVGAFFGFVPGKMTFATLPLTATAAGTLRSRWVMPFAHSARFTLYNPGPEAVTLEGDVVTVPRRWTHRSLHLHAKSTGPTWLAARPFRDVSVVNLAGRGVYVGTALGVEPTGPGWWGDGDEKIYVDGDEFPRWFGTGTDDYFGAAWADPTLFQHAYHAHPRHDQPTHEGGVGYLRCHILDRIPFTQSLRFDLEFRPWDPRQRVRWQTVSWWYARP